MSMPGTSGYTTEIFTRTGGDGRRTDTGRGTKGGGKEDTVTGGKREGKAEERDTKGMGREADAIRIGGYQPIVSRSKSGLEDCFCLAAFE